MLRFLVLLVLVIGGVVLLTKKPQTNLILPIPKIFGATQNQIVNNWYPKANFSSSSQNLYLSARSAIAVDFESGEILFTKDIDQRLPIASTLKIMTALVALETVDPSTKFTVSPAAATVGENSMGLSVGEELTLRDLLYGLMLVSGNDAAIAIAEGIAGSEQVYVALMNEKSKELGLKNTYFANATGLDEDSTNSYSSVYDMATIAHYTWENYPIFGQITSTAYYYIEATDKHKDFDLYNDTNLLTTYPGVQGIKPGFTWEAGLCLVTYAENGGKKILAVILGSDDRRGEMKELLDYSFGQYGITVEHPGLDL